MSDDLAQLNSVAHAPVRWDLNGQITIYGSLTLHDMLGLDRSTQQQSSCSQCPNSHAIAEPSAAIKPLTCSFVQVTAIFLAKYLISCYAICLAHMKSFDQTLQSVWSARRAAGLKAS